MQQVLVIDDEQPIREEVMEWLMFEGYEVTGAENGRVGLEAIGQRMPDLILCDVAMPEMDGRALIEQIISSRQPLPWTVLETPMV